MVAAAAAVAVAAADAAGVIAVEVGAAFVAAVMPSFVVVESYAGLVAVGEDFVVVDLESWAVASCCSVADAA